MKGGKERKNRRKYKMKRFKKKDEHLHYVGNEHISFHMSYVGVKSIKIWPRYRPYCVKKKSGLKGMCQEVQKCQGAQRACRWEYQQTYCIKNVVLGTSYLVKLKKWINCYTKSGIKACWKKNRPIIAGHPVRIGVDINWFLPLIIKIIGINKS